VLQERIEFEAEPNKILLYQILSFQPTFLPVSARRDKQKVRAPSKDAMYAVAAVQICCACSHYRRAMNRHRLLVGTCDRRGHFCSRSFLSGLRHFKERHAVSRLRLEHGSGANECALPGSASNWHRLPTRLRALLSPQVRARNCGVSSIVHRPGARTWGVIYQIRAGLRCRALARRARCARGHRSP
jgi:hypothetical protein